VDYAGRHLCRSLLVLASRRYFAFLLAVALEISLSLIDFNKRIPG